ncbi:MAG TPA: sulfatase-like hydrolase/transferase [Phycisphaerae bacterium]|nr:sulfatase-like hydrolase/transferase [Phycisphaerae bacterium]
MASRPNILWICTDSQRWDTLGCYGNPLVHTPHLDALAEEGIVFEQCFAQSPVCTPSRASFLTGRYPRTTRVRQNGQVMPKDEVLITHLLAEAGYTCGLSGKLHISACYPAQYPTGEPRVEDGYSAFHWSHHPSGDWATNEYNDWLAEQGVAFQTPPHPESRFVKVGMPAEYHQTTWCAHKAINFIEAAAPADRPWLFSLNPFDPHDNFDPPADYLERYLDRLADIPLPNYTPGELDHKPIFQRIDHRGAYNDPRNYPFPEMTDKDHRLVRAAYWAMIDLIDAQVGRVLAALERTGQRDSTIIIFTSDHGEMLGDHGVYLKGPYFYDPAVRVPLIVCCPALIPGGRRSAALVELTDVAPTLLDAVGLPRHAGMQGRSLWPRLTGDADPNRHRADVYCEYYNALACHKDPAAYATMLRTARHKLVVMHGQQPGELYDLAQDPAETHNLWDSPEHQEAKLALLQRLCDRMAWTADPLPLRTGCW